MRRVYVMRASTLTRLIKSGRAACHRCGVQFAIGDRVASRIGTESSRYHERCFEGTRV